MKYLCLSAKSTEDKMAKFDNYIKKKLLNYRYCH